MPTVLRADGLRFVVYPNDHPPAHVQVIGPGSTVIVELLGPQVRKTIGCVELDARRVPRLVTQLQLVLLRACKTYHG